MKIKSIEEIIDDHYDKIFDELCDRGDEFGELLIEVRVDVDGKTVRRSWADREKMLTERDKE